MGSYPSTIISALDDQGHPIESPILMQSTRNCLRLPQCGEAWTKKDTLPGVMPAHPKCRVYAAGAVKAILAAEHTKRTRKPTFYGPGCNLASAASTAHDGGGTTLCAIPVARLQRRTFYNNPFLVALCLRASISAEITYAGSAAIRRCVFSGRGRISHFGSSKHT